MALGLCCEWVNLKNGKLVNLLVARTLQLGKFDRGEYSENAIRKCYADNLQNLLAVLPVVHGSGIRFFRISSSMFPLFDKVNPEYYKNDKIIAQLKRIGDFIVKHNMRVTTHPGQFVVLSSDDKNVVKNSVRELNFHGWVFDQMGLPRSPLCSINVHGGKAEREINLLHGIEQLDDSAKTRLTLENDEFSYSISKLEFVSHDTGVPLVFDSHHHSFNTDDLSDTEAMERAIATWPQGVKPTTHLSNTLPEFRGSTATVSKKRIHSNYLDYVPQCQLEAHNQGRIDIEIEAKAKNLAIFKAVENLKLMLA